MTASDRVLTYVELAVAPLDAVRRNLLALTLRSPFTVLVRVREARLAALGSLGVLAALAATLLFPAALFVLSPILLGVPHVASDIRYLVLRRRLPRWWKWTVLAASASLLAVHVMEELAPTDALLRLEVVLGAVWLLGAALAGALWSGSTRRLWLALPVVSAISFAAIARPDQAVLALTHVHNVVALLLWFLVFRRLGGAAPAAWRARVVLLPVVLIALGLALTLSGVALVDGSTRSPALGVDLADVSGWLVPGVEGAWAEALTVSYVFLQAIHYSVWLVWIPQEAVRGEGTPTFRMSVRSLARDFGAAGALALVAAVLGVLGFAVARGAGQTREIYLSLTAFHGYLELAVLAFMATAGRMALR